MKKPLKIQASSISRILKCPGSCTLESKLPDRLRYFAFKDAAEYGTLCHAFGEEQLRSLSGMEAAESFNSLQAWKHPRFDEIQSIGSTYAKAVHKNRLKNGKLFVEEKFRTTISGIDCVAKADAYYVNDKDFRGFDLKSGQYDYSESAPLQILFGAKLWCYLNDKNDGRRLTAYTVQPAYYNESRRVVVSNEERYARTGFVGFIDDIKKRQKEFNPGDHCKMCSAILTCKAVKNLIEEFNEMAKKATKEDLEFKAIYEKKGAVIAFFDALDAYLKNELETGKRIDGLYLEEYSGRRRWIDADMVADKLKYLKDKIFEPKQLKSPAQVEKLAGKENIVGLFETPRLKRVAIRTNTFESFDL